MLNKINFLLIFIFLLFSTSIAQNTENKYKLTGLTNSALNSEIKTGIKEIDISLEKKSPAVAGLLSLVLPGAGHYYSGRMDVGSYFLGTDIALWIGLFGVNYYAGIMRDDSRKFASQHAGLTIDGKDDNYFANVGNYLNIYNYNNEKLQSGEYNKMYDINTHFWNWDSPGNQSEFEKQRKRSERTYNLSPIIATGLIINRLVSALSAILLTNKYNNGSGIGISSDLTKSPFNKIDGIKINLVKSF